MMSPLVLGKMIEWGVPTIFTLHDMGHFTGGCHYSAGCNGFAAQCQPCHQVHSDELGLIAAGLAAKRANYCKPNVRAVSPSAWLAGEADRSAVFPAPVHVIANSIETDIFHSRDRDAARRALGLEEGTRAILFGVYDDAENRKGYRRLIEVLERAMAIPAFADLVSRDSIRILAFGKSGHDLNEIGIPSMSLGWVGDDQRLSEIYRAADLCVLPSSEDNQ
ncbi:hypothetical protein HI113_43580, partial [Corallococcus exiguus]|uniref:hypothetical protein n=1 Tax=Corallococcus exiguus TaxID=83462 RepID=UPI00179AC1E3